MTETIKCLVVDDEKLARTLLRSYIEKLPYLQLVGECKDALDAIAMLRKEQVDVVFLDIQMPELSGIELLNSMPEKPLVVFTTAYQQYALEGYQLDAVDYLLKPFRFDRFLQAVNKTARRLQWEPQPLPDAPPQAQPERAFILINASHTLHKVFLDEVLYIQGMREYVAFHLPGKRIITYQSLKQLEQELPKPAFVRIHKSYIVAADKVTAISSGTVCVGETELPIGGSYKAGVKGWTL